jgi:Mpv17 / PMP22 family
MTLLKVTSRYICRNNLLLVEVVVFLLLLSAACDRSKDCHKTYSSSLVTALFLPPTNIVHHHNANHQHMDRFQRSSVVVPKINSRIQTQHTHSTTKVNHKKAVAYHLYMVNAYISMIDQFVQSSPYTTAAIACGIKASSADFIAQKRQLRKRNEKNNSNKRDIEGLLKTESAATPPPTTNKVKTDIARNIAFLLYGAFYQGMGQEYIYNHLYPLYFGTGTNMVTVFMKVAFDLLLQTTLLTLPVAYGIKAMIYKYSFQEAFRRYIDDIRNHGLLIKYFTLWGPVQCITFSIIPEHYRISFIAIVSFFWLIILSTISSRVRSTVSTTNLTTTSITTNATDATRIYLPVAMSTQECELVDGLTCNIDG